MSKSNLETLEAARKLIRFKKNWTQRVYARSVSNRLVQPDSRRAVCWCAAGALRKVSGRDWPAAFDLLNESTKELYNLGVFDANDTHTHAEVLAAFDAAIAKAKAEATNVL